MMDERLGSFFLLSLGVSIPEDIQWNLY